LAALRANPADNRPRFYPPGQHPASAKWRAELKRALALEATLRSMQEDPNKSLNEYIEYLQNQLAQFEESESEAKMYAWEILTRRR
jgi:uncharacterized protein YlxW (UPF0749 family)